MTDYKVLYLIRFYKGKFKDRTIPLAVFISEIENDGLISYLIDNDYLTEYVGGEEYFDILSRVIV